VLVNCHPVKNASKDNLVPLGGSAFLNEIDGNLTLWSSAEKQTSLHWQGKFRGAEFEPMSFNLKITESTKVADSDGQLIPSVVAVPMSETMLDMAERKQESDSEELLKAIYNNKRASISRLAAICGWISNGHPYKSKVFRIAEELLTDKLIERRGSKYRVTPKGRKELGVGNDE
jgi:hypothetical protein